MLTLVLCAALAQTPVPQKIALVQGGNFGVSQKRLIELLRSVRDVLKASGFDAIEPKYTCETPDCILGAGKLVNVESVISIAFALVGKETTIDVEALQVADGRSLAAATFTLAPGKSVTGADVEAFLKQLKDELKPKEVAPADAPKQVSLVPDEGPPKPPRAAVEQKPAPTVAIIVAAGAVAAGVAAAALVAVAYSDGNAALAALRNQAMPYPYVGISKQQAQMRLQPTNDLYTASLISACVAGALAVIAVVLFATY